MGRRGPRGKIIPGNWAGLMAGRPPPIGCHEASREFGAEIPEETWEKIFTAVWWLNLRLWELDNVPRANQNRNDPRSFEVWRQDTLRWLRKIREELQSLRESGFLSVVARNLFLHPSRPSLGLGDPNRLLVVAPLERALSELDSFAEILERAQARLLVDAGSEPQLRAQCVREIAAALQEAGFLVKLMPTKLWKELGAYENDLTGFERLLRALGVATQDDSGKLARWVREALNKN